MASKKPSDHVLSVVKAGISGVPVVGGPVSSLISDYIPSASQRAMDEFVQGLSEQLKILENRIDIATIDKDEFSELFKSTYLVVARSHKAQKLRSAANLFSNILLKENDDSKLKYTELDHLIRALESLSDGALTVHRKLVEFATEEEAKSTRQVAKDFSLTMSHLQTITNEEDASFLLGLLQELASWNFVEIVTPQVNGRNNRSVILTPLGRRFANAIQDGDLSS